jgi:hypothetical protein
LSTIGHLDRNLLGLGHHILGLAQSGFTGVHPGFPGIQISTVLIHLGQQVSVPDGRGRAQGVIRGAVDLFLGRQFFIDRIQAFGQLLNPPFQAIEKGRGGYTHGWLSFISFVVS